MRWKLFKPNVEKLKEKRNINRLIKTLSDNDVELRRRAASALGEIGGEESVEPLIQLLGDSDVELRKKAVFALGEIGDEKAVGSLMQLLGDTNIELRRIAVSALGEIGDSKAVEPLKQLLGDSDVELHKKAVSALVVIIKMLKEKGDINQLIKIRRSNDNDVIQRIISQVIDGERNRCFYCGKTVYPAMGKRCSVCNLIVCDEHILPESHGCKGTYIPPSGYAISRTRKVTSQEGALPSEEDLSGY